MDNRKNTTTPAARHAAQAAIQAALALRAAGFHAQAAQIWNSAKEVIAQ